MKMKLSEACQSIADGDHQAPPKSENGIPFITISCMDPNGGSPDYSSAAKVPFGYYASLSDNRRARAGDVLLSVVGSLGIPYLVREGDCFAFQRHIAILRPSEKILPEFLYYQLKSPASYHYIDSVAQGAAQRTFTLTQLREMEVEVPSLGKQRRIADILSASDKLIENNRRQIALLEEAAQRLYKEWFVDLHFPGTVRRSEEKCLPDGWKKGTLGEIAEFRRGKVIKATETSEGQIPVVAGGLQPAYYHNKSNAFGPVITISGSGANAGFTRLYSENIWASDCSYVESKMSNVLYFVYETAVVIGHGFRHLQRGSAQPHVYPSHINSLDVVIPTGDLQERYCNAVEPLFSKRKQCEQTVSFAREVRNRLLPKLMSGEIEV